MKSVELFAGAGGLGMGASLAGFTPLAVIEWDKWACDTIRENQKRDYPLVRNWPLWEGDVRSFDWSTLSGEIDLLTGGPPCQPFSMGGKHKAYGDARDMFPATVEVVRKLRPKAFVIENVKGLTRASFSNYFQYILLQLEFPEIVRKSRETWMEHLRRLQEQKTAGKSWDKGLVYNVVTTLANAANYGAPQKRERVFIVGFRADIKTEWSFPRPTHSFDALLYSQWVTGEYWDRHGVAPSKRPSLPTRYQARISKLGTLLIPPREKAWLTIRDALIDVPDPREKDAGQFNNHKFQGGAKVYKGHTGSPVDFPAKTLKAGAHGVPGGENMMVLPGGEVRYFTVRESARLQTFPDGYVFHGSWTETMRQLGNAVPIVLARRVIASVAEGLLHNEIRRVNDTRSELMA